MVYFLFELRYYYSTTKWKFLTLLKPNIIISSATPHHINYLLVLCGVALEIIIFGFKSVKNVHFVVE